MKREDYLYQKVLSDIYKQKDLLLAKEDKSFLDWKEGCCPYLGETSDFAMMVGYSNGYKPNSAQAKFNDRDGIEFRYYDEEDFMEHLDEAKEAIEEAIKVSARNSAGVMMCNLPSFWRDSEELAFILASFEYSFPPKKEYHCEKTLEMSL